MDCNVLVLLVFVASALLIGVKTQQEATNKLNKASFKLFLEAQRLNIKDDNLVVSPVSMLTLVALYSWGTSGQLKQEITKGLGYDNSVDLIVAYQILSSNLSYTDPRVLAMANKVYVAAGNRFTETFSHMAKNFKAEIGTLDFTNPPLAAFIINDWASQKTNGMISHAVKELPSSTLVALFNAIYFRGSWLYPFNRNTQYEDFFTYSGNVVKKPMMKVTTYMQYANVPGIGEFLEIPYRETGFNMVVGLPAQGANGLPTLLRTLADAPHLLHVGLLPMREPQTVELHFPRFEIRSKLDMTDILIGMGLGGIFLRPADHLVEKSQPAVSAAFQEAVIKVDEEGTEASALSALVMAMYSPGMPMPMTFKANRPFVFAILHDRKVLFIGTVTN